MTFEQYVWDSVCFFDAEKKVWWYCRYNGEEIELTETKDCVWENGGGFYCSQCQEHILGDTSGVIKHWEEKADYHR